MDLAKFGLSLKLVVIMVFFFTPKASNSPRDSLCLRCGLINQRAFLSVSPQLAFFPLVFASILCSISQKESVFQHSPMYLSHLVLPEACQPLDVGEGKQLSLIL